MGSDEIEGLLERFFAAIEAGDRDTVAGFYADDVQVWHSVTDRTVGKADSLAILDWIMTPGVTRRYEQQEQLVVGSRVSRRHVLHIGVPGHEDLRLVAGIWFTVEDGLIRRIDEYVDAKATDRLLAMIPVGGS